MTSKFKDLEKIFNMVKSTKLKVAIEKKYNFEDVSDAFSRLESGRVRVDAIIV